ncbi:uncharacterized protein [Engystomops pustulosus]|uniref:uncharacterized protein n=1 Tax=Engystomops pustulosus TaxID=76066 RepID=UPI003AFA8C3A
MKSLVLSLFLLFLSGIYGSPVTPVEQQPPKPAVRDSVKSLVHNALVFGAELVSNLESSEKDRLAVLGNRAQKLKVSYYNLAYGISDYLGDIIKEVYKEINETYPVYTSKVLPLLGAFVVHTVNSLRVTAEEIQPYFEKFEEKVKVHQITFWDEILPILQKKTKPVIDALKAGLDPHIEEVHKEVEAANAKEEASPLSEQTEKELKEMEENYNVAEKLQKILMFDKNVLKKMLSQLAIFNNNNA